MSARVFLATLAAAGVVASACGGDGASSLNTVPPVVSVDVSSSMSTSTDPSSMPTTPPSTAATSPTAVGDQPIDTVPGERPQLVDFGAGLLPDEAFGDPWELQWRQSDRPGYEAGPNQTTCDPYWSIELLRTTGGAHAMWWTDGGNANHHVGRLPRSIRSLDALALLAGECPTVKWLEGGSFDVTAITVDDGYAFRFDDAAAGQATWFAVTRLGELVSVLDVPLWTGVDGTMPPFTEDDVRRLVADMRAHLLRVTSETRPSPGTTTVAPPVLTPASTTTVAESPPPTTSPPPSGLAALLLTAEDLPSDFEPPTVREFGHGTRDEEVEAVCPAFESVHEIDRMFEWSLRSGNELVEFEQIIGRASSADEATSVVRQFGDVAACDLSELFGGEVTTSGGELTAAGADAASILRLEAEDMLAGELVLVAIGDIVMAITTEADSGVGIDAFDLDALVTLAVDRVGAVGG